MTNSAVLLDMLADPANSPLLTGILRGVEKESLRVSPEGVIAQTPHPKALGSALTHPSITTDYSEALLEFISSPSHRVEQVLEQLMSIHQFTYQYLQEEWLWPASMPCILPSDKDIPIAQYGSSNNGKMKSVYRLGLGLRYGRKMQTISGIHYNFSLPNSFWALLHRQSGSLDSLEQFKTDQYFALIRNFRRYYWLLLYLFGASPAVCSSFVKGMAHQLAPLDESSHTLYTPFATSLRMGDLGYQSSAQQSLVIDYNDLPSYLQTLCNAIRQPYADYESIGITNDHGEHHQLNTSLLQIENEFYSPIRPKRTAKRGETALQALRARGVEYIEVRCLDLNPFEPLGLTVPQMHFLDCFLLFCLLEPSPPSDTEENQRIQRNQHQTVYHGRDPKATLETLGGNRSLREWGSELLERMIPIAEILDKAYGQESHEYSLRQQQELLSNADLTPSARVLSSLKENQWNFKTFALHQAKQNADSISAIPLNLNTQKELERSATASWQSLHELEAQESPSFETFLQNYYQQYHRCSEMSDT